MKHLLACALVLVLVGCVQSPTKETRVVDDRPGLTFELYSSATGEHELFIDDVSYGPVSQYLEGENRLRLVDGTHRVELRHKGEVTFSQRVYLGAGVNRVIKVGTNE
ncbi:hypothetical protein EDC38_0381 [Marinimicrobium koreense]|uniref:PEGA domain-containing protein n=1 Tax=Marinimicrobium koreense TaxID=306545 RepID=A0A3N1NUG1_9GAMM|nr:hypothetical protein [Marinimicrobium koreense]ROQ19793.1 hypothetical protein EDC38_0381 [Marinimicrobium koreense]